ncbi:MAG: hypothetical protein P8Z79_07060 [Sedimentisphaerales bacterium]|jgi:hypothetical protein
MMRWIIYLFVDLVRHVLDRKGWRCAIPVIVVGIGMAVLFYVVFTPRDVTYPKADRAGEYQEHMRYLMRASAESLPDLSGLRGGLLGTTIAIVSREDLPLFTKKLRYTLHKAAGDHFLFHVITVGGMTVRDIDQPLLDATKRLQLSGEPNIEIVIVAPSTISDQTKQTLEERGLRVCLIDGP